MLQRAPDTSFQRQQNLIGGEWVDADDGGTIDVVNPATDEVIGTVPASGEAETVRAIEAAQKAFESFRHTSAAERAKMLRELHDAILDHQDALAELLTLEQGKPLAEAKGEVAGSAAYVLWFAEEARRIYGEIIPSPFPNRQILAMREPVGVVAAITPWNFPSSMLSRKIGPAIAAGCASVIKPAIQTPYSGLAWGLLAEEAGVPPGVVNIVTGKASTIGAALMADKRVRKITFTGSTEVGKILIRQSADTVKRASMELGGNAPFIIFDDADLDRAVEGAKLAKYRNSGQTCICTNRFIVQAGIHDAFVERFAEVAKGLKVGSGFDDDTEQGPLIDDRALEKVEDLLSDMTSKGAKVVAGGKRHELGRTFFEPTVVSGATREMRVADEEIFGPIAAIYRFETEEEAVSLANDTDFGLAGYFYTADLGRAFRVAGALEYGMVGVNDGFITTEVAPFGGVKESGLGREGGPQGIEEYLNVKYVSMGGLGA